MISEELARFLESGIAIYFAARKADLDPEGARVWAVVVDADRARLTAFVQKPVGQALLPVLNVHPEMAVCFSRPTDHRSCQAKGIFVGARPARAGEKGIVQRQADGFLGELEAVGIPRAATARWKSWPCLALTMRVTHLFEQTPGPGTGGPLS